MKYYINELKWILKLWPLLFTKEKHVYSIYTTAEFDISNYKPAGVYDVSLENTIGSLSFSCIKMMLKIIKFIIVEVLY